MVSEFRPDSPKCPDGWNGCAVASTEAIILRYRPGEALPKQIQLGASMGLRHRQADKHAEKHRRSKHGKCPSAWCPYCSYLELKARNIPVAYGRLSIPQLRAHLAKRHAMHLGGWYKAIHLVGSKSYSKSVPARGRSDNGRGGDYMHSIVVWRVGRTKTDGSPATYIVSDPDFGSPARPRMPPFCEYDAGEIEAFYRNGPFAVCYCLQAPPPIGPKPAVSVATAVVVPKPAIDTPAPPPGVTLKFGGQLKWRGLYVASSPEGARQRRSPFIRNGNVIRTLPRGTKFRCAQTTFAGTNVGGSTRWHGDASGEVWMHSSVLERVPKG